MAKPFDRISFDAFTPTGSGPRMADLYPPHPFPPHVARYRGRPPYMTTNAMREELRRRGDA